MFDPIEIARCEKNRDDETRLVALAAHRILPRENIDQLLEGLNTDRARHVANQILTGEVDPNESQQNQKIITRLIKAGAER